MLKPWNNDELEGLYRCLVKRHDSVESFLDIYAVTLTRSDRQPSAERVPSSGGTPNREPLSILSPSSIDDLLAKVREEDEIPFWADVWDSAVGLAGYLCRMAVGRRGPLESVRALELGCGVGACGLAAARLGAIVTGVDFAPEALDFARVNAWLNGLDIHFVGADIRTLDLAGAEFDLILGSDILYEPKLHASLATAMDKHLAPGGHVLLADPGRKWASTFLDLVEPEGWTCAMDQIDAHTPRGVKTVDILALRRSEP